MLLRRIEARDAPARVRVVLDPRAGFGRHKMTQLKSGTAVWTARSGPLHLRWSAAGRPGSGTRAASSSSSSWPPGEHHDLVLESIRPGPAR